MFKIGPVEILRAVRDGAALDPQALRHFVFGIAHGHVPDYQAAAFTMAVFFRGLSPELTVALTLAMRDSGRVVDLSHVAGIKVDKHSTGGVGDKISIPLAPLVAACGVPVPMVSGRGLGHTGGTLDKLESIPGFRVSLSIDEIQKQMHRLGVCMAGQTEDLAPADRRLYALRDVTASIESIPLITSSILSKKLAEGIDALVLDVKVGRGAFMKDLTSARALAQSLVAVGTGAGIQVRAILSRMDAPLGRTIGNALEVKESLEILKGEGPADTTELTYVLAEEMLLLGKVAKDPKDARQRLERAIHTGLALQKFVQLLEAQGGDPRIVDNPELLPRAQRTEDIVAERAAYLTDVDAYALGLLAVKMGAGRARAEDKVDPAVGIELLKKPGAYVSRGEPVLRLHLGRKVDTSAARAALTWSSAAPAPAFLILDRVS